MFDALRKAIQEGDLEKAKELSAVTDFEEFKAFFEESGQDYSINNCRYNDTYYDSETNTVKEANTISLSRSDTDTDIQFDKETGKLIVIR